MTLVEIMITLVISSILAGSTFMFFAGQQRIYETQTKMLNIQQNLWASMEVVARYARAAGSGMFECTRPASYAIEGSTPGARVRSTYPSPTPLSTNLGSRPATGLRAFDDATATLQWIPPIWIVNNSTGTGPDAAVRPGTDVLTVAFGNRTSGTDIDALLGADVTDSTAGTMMLATAGTDAMFRTGEFVLAMRNPPWSFGSDPASDRGCTLFQITAIPGTGTMLTHGSMAMNGGRTWNPTGVVADMMPTDPATSTSMIYPASTAGLRNFGQLTWIRFFVSDGPNGIPNLMMQRLDLPVAGLGAPQVLAEGIEDLQIAYACDTGSLGAANLLALNGTLDEGTTVISRQTDEWVNNVENDSIAAINTDGYCNLPPAIRITLVVRSLFPDNLIDPTVTNNGPMDVEDHIQVGSPRPRDQFRRRILSTTIFPRNNRPTL
jgi:Tfp pilus assembly protein PilW